jgi:hypothetical protein
MITATTLVFRSSPKSIMHQETFVHSVVILIFNRLSKLPALYYLFVGSPFVFINLRTLCAKRRPIGAFSPSKDLLTYSRISLYLHL